MIRKSVVSTASNYAPQYGQGFHSVEIESITNIDGRYKYFIVLLNINDMIELQVERAGVERELREQRGGEQQRPRVQEGLHRHFQSEV